MQRAPRIQPEAQMNRPLMILFAKAPVPGRVKTRLIPRLSAEEAARLHKRLVEHAWQRLSGLRDAASLELHTDVPTACWSEMHPRRLQSPGDLGRRLFHALETGLRRTPLCLVVGSDAPGLPESHLRQMLDSKADVTLGPTADGGYWAIACRRVHPAMFEGVRWSTPDAFEDTRRATEACGLSVASGAVWFDIDEPDDLIRLAAYPDLCERE